MQVLGAEIVEIDFAPFRETGQLLYGGPWVAARLTAFGGFLAKHPEAVLPVTRTIQLSVEAFGKFMALVNPPLTIGTVELSDGSHVKGFLCESYAIQGARDISSFGGWRQFLSNPG